MKFYVSTWGSNPGRISNLVVSQRLDEVMALFFGKNLLDLVGVLNLRPHERR